MPLYTRKSQELIFYFKMQMTLAYNTYQTAYEKENNQLSDKLVAVSKLDILSIGRSC